MSFESLLDVDIAQDREYLDGFEDILPQVLTLCRTDDVAHGQAYHS